MNMDTVTQYLRDKPQAVGDCSFNEEAEVFKVSGKMFTLCVSQTIG